MSFIAQYHNRCGFCDEDLKGDEAEYTEDDTLVHTACLGAYEGGAHPVAVGRNEKRCTSCFTVHAGECL